MKSVPAGASVHRCPARRTISRNALASGLNAFGRRQYPFFPFEASFFRPHQSPVYGSKRAINALNAGDLALSPPAGPESPAPKISFSIVAGAASAIRVYARGRFPERSCMVRISPCLQQFRPSLLLCIRNVPEKSSKNCRCNRATQRIPESFRVQL